MSRWWWKGQWKEQSRKVPKQTMRIWAQKHNREIAQRLRDAIQQEGPMDTYALAEHLGVTSRTIWRVAPLTLERIMRSHVREYAQLTYVQNGATIRRKACQALIPMTIWHLPGQPPRKTELDDDDDDNAMSWDAFRKQLNASAAKLEARLRIR